MYSVKINDKVYNYEENKTLEVIAKELNINCLAAKVNNRNEAALCREHNRANVMTLSEYTEDLEGILDNFINTKPSVEEKHIRRVNKILSIQEN